MRKVRTAELIDGMVIAKPVYGSDGQLLLNSGLTMVDGYRRHLQRLGIPAVYIVDGRMEGVEVADVVHEQTRLEATVAVRDVVDAVRVKSQHQLTRKVVIPDDSLRSAVSKIIEDLMGNPAVLVSMTDIRTSDDITFAHSVNVAILSVMVAMSMGWAETRIRDLAMGAILHDIGKVQVPDAIVKKQEALTAAELEEMRKHPSHGFNILRTQQNLSIVSAHVAFQHHERLNGEGFPRRLKGGEIHEFARIAAVTDVYDSLTTERTLRRAFTPVEAFAMLQGINNFYDPDVVKALQDCVALYPVGSLVELNTRERGLVVASRKGMTDQPVVRVIYDWSGTEVKRPHDIDLSQQSDLFITRTVTKWQTAGDGLDFAAIKQML